MRAAEGEARGARCASSSYMKVEIRFSGPAVPVWPSHGPDGTRPSSDTSAATAVAVGVASALDGRREDEGCVVDGLSRLRGMHSSCVSGDGSLQRLGFTAGQ